MPTSDDDEPRTREGVLILIPVYNDWGALAKLLASIDRTLDEHGLRADLLVVDDASTRKVAPDFPGFAMPRIGRVDVLELRRNLGHQRAIAIGLSYVEDHDPPRALVVMDGDGEDDPADIPRLLARCEAEGWTKIVFAERAKRSESPAFRLFYGLYKLVHLILTGQRVRVGNFSVIPRARLASLVVVSEIWNHYAAAAFASRLPFALVPTSRAKRLDGKSSMNFIRLVGHGLSAISVYGELVSVRLLVALGVLVGACLVGLGVTVGLRFFTDLAVPGWATTAAGLLTIVLLQAVMFAFLLVFLILGGRNGLTFLPIRDYAHFVGRVTSLDPGRAAAARHPEESRPRAEG
jgi:polyisoprenyl-phosphate glycosyltransferase